LGKYGHLRPPALGIFLDEAVFDAASERRPDLAHATRPGVGIERYGPTELRVGEGTIVDLNADARIGKRARRMSALDIEVVLELVRFRWLWIIRHIGWPGMHSLQACRKKKDVR
jgi:hypothetical protein